ncbi:hypothetical protein [Undibacterium sp. TS12]|uniref:hypothetical protein n=1 Tax=Undibacterium sp. TS12 TaxID=2908202 RepID=UPI001F4C7F68|nr:hypothetical protein [Undibacterium sp. TS12]MCH8619229.1 hypothetical protein [Undibacterium sp. TS12]
MANQFAARRKQFLDVGFNPPIALSTCYCSTAESGSLNESDKQKADPAISQDRL